ncbi:MAG: Holliday junction resolvase RuvX, partial [Pseudomonadota bacterium]|nr:Holliday junction resolvase RuvX [Pseudomonadota bacterium]
VVGLPLDEDNNETTTSQKIRLFANKLSNENKINVVFVDEYYSSQEAIERLNLKGKDQKTRNSGIVDSVSATIILERYFTNEGIIV